MTKEIYLALKAQLTNEIPEIENVDWFLNQFEQDDEDHVLITTGCYIRFLPTDWKTLPLGVQNTVLQFEIHLVNETAYGDERDMLDTNYIDHLAQESKIFKALQNMRFHLNDVTPSVTDNRVLMESIVRIKQKHHEEINNLIRTHQTFQNVVYDYSATPNYQEVEAQISCDIQVQQTTIT